MQVGDLVRYKYMHHIYGIVLTVVPNAWVNFQYTIYWYNKDEFFAYCTERLFYSEEELEAVS